MRSRSAELNRPEVEFMFPSPGSLGRLSGILKWLLSFPAAVRSLWFREYHDSRIILEQKGDLRYFSIAGGIQRNVVRGVIVLGFSTVSGLVVLAFVSLILMFGNAKLERSHNEVYKALVEGSSDLREAGGKEINQAGMLDLAGSIRERDHEFRQLVSKYSIALVEENSSLKARLADSSLSAQAIGFIQGQAPIGGFDSPRTRIGHSQLSGMFLDEAEKNRALKDVLNSLPSVMPLKDFSLSSPFGIRNHPLGGPSKFHMGVDLVPGESDEIRPAKAGKVVLAHDYQNYGNTVIIRHDRGIETLYAHLASIKVTQGQDVDPDTVIGLAGNTGSSTGKHLHFEISVGGYPVDPLKVIEAAYHVQKSTKQ